MRYLGFTICRVSIVSLVVLLTAAPYCSAAIFSGKVVDVEGNPVPDVMVTIDSYEGKFIPDRFRLDMHERVFPPPEPTKSNANGEFAIDNIVSPTVNALKLFGGFQSDYELISIEMQGISLYIPRHGRIMHEGFPFGLEEENDIKDVKITVRLRMKVSGQVLDADGAPLSNARVNMRVKRRRKSGGGGSGGGTTTLDEEGKFTRYVNYAAYITVSVTYQGQTVESKEIWLEQGQRLEGLTLKLKEKIAAPKIPEEVRQQIQGQPDFERRQAFHERRRKGVWAINPANRHAYKRIECQTPEEAIEIAKEEGAHLVSINDAAEQEWLLYVFGTENFWIGFTDGIRKNDKEWDDGDPLTYTNWDENNLISESDKDTEKNEQTKYTVLIGVTGKWQRTRSDGHLVNITEKAILEKADLMIGAPEPDENTE